MTTAKSKSCVYVRWGALLLILALMLSLSACAGSSKSNTQPPPEASPSVQSAPTPAQPSSSAPPATQAVVKEIPREAFRVVYNASLRESPRSSAKVITLLAKGEKVLLISTAGNWISIESSDGKIGWLLRKQVVPLK